MPPPSPVGRQTPPPRVGAAATCQTSRPLSRAAVLATDELVAENPRVDGAGRRCGLCRGPETRGRLLGGPGDPVCGLHCSGSYCLDHHASVLRVQAQRVLGCSHRAAGTTVTGHPSNHSQDSVTQGWRVRDRPWLPATLASPAWWLVPPEQEMATVLEVTPWLRRVLITGSPSLSPAHVLQAKESRAAWVPGPSLKCVAWVPGPRLKDASVVGGRNERNVL